MQFSKNWLYEWVNLKVPTDELASILTMAGLEVDSITRSEKFEGVVVAEIKAVVEHPKKDHLKVCQLDAGNQSIQVVTGAPNIVVGQKVVFAPVGTYLPAIHKRGQTLQETDFSGVSSSGMLLSFAEIGLAEKSDAIIELSVQAPVGQDVWEYLHLDDDIIDIDLTPNRGDCLSIQGIAREAHALTKAEYNPIKIDPVAPLHDQSLSVTLEAPNACARYCGRVIKNVNCTKPTPEWMVEKLRRSNVRAINPVVDIMNYIMIELGQPMHAFDLDKIDKEIIVKMSQGGEEIKLLDGQDLTTQVDTLMICDAKNPLAVAGIMGGDDSAVSDTTQNIFLESAYFAPEIIAGKGRQYGLHTDSSHRFERGVDPSGQALAIERATQWILDICGGEPGPVTDVIADEHLPKKSPITLSVPRANILLGFDVDKETIVLDLKRLQCEVEDAGEAQIKVTPPSFRFDINIEEDLVEEIARLKGYDNIELKLPEGALKPVRQKVYPENRLKQVLVDEGYQEAITYSFVDENLQRLVHPDIENIVLANPIASDMNVMRASLWPGLLQALAYNMHRQQLNLSLFEIGLVFNQVDSKLIQDKKLGGVLSGSIAKEHWSQKAKPLDFYDVKGHIERLWQTTGKSIEDLSWEPAQLPALHPGQTAKVVYQGQAIGYVGALHPQLEKQLDLDGPVYLFELTANTLLTLAELNYSKPSMFPTARRDLSFVLDEQKTCGEITQWLKQEGGELLKDIVVFDVYQGKGVPEGHKSMALGLIWQNLQRTLVDSEVDDVVNHLIKGLKDTFGAQLRD